MTDNFGLTKRWTKGPICEISGQMRKDIAAGTYNAYIVVKDDEGNLAKTEFTFIVKEKPIPSISLELSGRSGEVDQNVEAGDSIKPIVFYKEHALELVLPNFPGGYERIENDDTVTIIGLIQEGSRGLHDIVLSVIGPENQASAKATIEVIPATMTFDLVEGRDNQTVVAGQDIAPIVYQYSHMYSVKGNVPANLKVEQDKEKKQVKISGTIDPESATHEYTYTFELTDYYENTKTVTGKINVVASSSSTPIEDLSSSSAMSSGSDHSSNIVAAMPSFVFSYANNELTVVSPNSAMVRVQVFDLMGHVVETFTESATSVKNFSLASLTKGNYVVRIESALAVRLAKITVK